MPHTVPLARKHIPPHRVGPAGALHPAVEPGAGGAVEAEFVRNTAGSGVDRGREDVNTSEAVPTARLRQKAPGKIGRQSSDGDPLAASIGSPPIAGFRVVGGWAQTVEAGAPEELTGTGIEN